MVGTPKAIRLNTVITRDQRTLIKLDDTLDTNINWSVWNGIVHGIESYKKWKQSANVVGIIVTDLDDNDYAFEELYKLSKNVYVIAITNNILLRKSEEYWTDNYDNIINLDYVLDTYGFIDVPWNKSVDDAVAICSIILRQNRIINLCDELIHSERKVLMNKMNISINSTRNPEECWIFTQFFKHISNRRYKEIKECLINNCKCPFITKIVLLNEKDYSNEWANIPGSSKIHQIITGKRITYWDFLSSVREIAPNNCFVILANADIYFDHTLKELWKVNMTDKMFGLLRWDVQEDRDDPPKIFGPRSDSQDSWIMLAKSIKDRTFDKNTFEYELGKPGCDNKFTSDMIRMKMLIANPALSIKSYHIHISNMRNYTKADYIKTDIYAVVDPSRILDMKHTPVPDVKPLYLNNEDVEFEVKSSSVSNSISYCTLLEKHGRFKWEASVENYYFDRVPIYTWSQGFVTPNGLVSDFKNIYTGKDTVNYNYWPNANVNLFSPVKRTECMFAIPFYDTSIFENFNTYLLYYLSRVTRLLKDYPDTSFWIPHDFSNNMGNFIWNTEYNGVEFDNKSVVYANKVIGYLPGPHEISVEDICGLRELYPAWQSKPTKKQCVVITDSILDNKFIDAFGTILKETLADNWNIIVSKNNNIVEDNISGSSMCVFIGGEGIINKWSHLWMLPKDCCIVEFQYDTNVDGEFQHMAHVSGYKSWIYLIGKNDIQLDGNDSIRSFILNSMTKWLNKNSDEICAY
jgi:hypothetical protein